jgi:hypothetical protein
VFDDVISRIRPKVVYLFAVDPQLDTVNAFIKRLAGISKYIIRNQAGETTMIELASTMGTSENCLKSGLTWLATKGLMSWEEVDESGSLILYPPNINTGSENQISQIESELTSCLREIKAFRKYFSTVNTGTLFPGI